MFPKDPKLQRIGAGVAALLGAGVGLGIEGAAHALDRVLPGDRLAAQLAVGGGGIAVAAGTALATRGRSTGGAAMLQTAGVLAGAGGAAGVASTVVARADGHLPGHDGIAQAGASALAGAAMLGVSMRASHAARGMSHLLPDLPELAVDPARVGRLAVDHGLGVRAPLTSGAADSLASWSAMPAAGRRFLTQVPRAAEIRSVMGSEAKEPIRAYVGIAHADAALDEAAQVAQRADLAVAELERLGAFGRFEQLADGSRRMVEPPRRSILVAAPTSTGFVNPVAASSHEFMNLGDTATVAVQVGLKKSAGELHHITRATATHQAVVERVSKRIAELPVEHRPAFNVYGESFGAWASQNGFLGTGEGNMSRLGRTFGKWNGPVEFASAGGLSRYEALGVDKAMYVGTPETARLRPRLLADEAITGGPRPQAVQVRNLPHARELGIDGAREARVTFLQHDADPVGLFHPRLLWERPEWLGAAATRGENIPPQIRWKPGVTALQTALDQQMAQYFRQGVLEAKGHDYRSEVTYVMRRALDAGHVTDDQVARIREWNRQLEEIHALHTKQAAELPPAR